MLKASSFLLLLVFISNLASLPGDTDICNEDSLKVAVQSGQLSYARWLAQNQQDQTCQASLRKLYIQEADLFLQGAYQENRPLIIQDSHHSHSENRPVAVIDQDYNCWNADIAVGANIVMDLWDRCCSQLGGINDDRHEKARASYLFSSMLDGDDPCIRYYNGQHRKMCCDLVQGSLSYLHLPFLNEMAIRLRVKTDVNSVEVYDLEQDGFLRKYDPASILWPTAYLLSLCLADTIKCGIPEIYTATSNHPPSSSDGLAIELGSGIGAPSIVLSKTLDRLLKRSSLNLDTSSLVVATDKALHALSLVQSNVRAANASVTTMMLDFADASSVTSCRRRYGRFSIIIGSSLQSLFDDTTGLDPNHNLWNILDSLLIEYDENPFAVVILAHSIYTLQEPPSGSKFQLLRKVSGQQFGMTTRHGDESSDFEISILSRTPPTLQMQCEL